MRKLSVHQILTAAFLLTLIIVSRRFLSINMGVMRIGISYTFMIAAGLILNFVLGLTTVVLADTLYIFLTGKIGIWHYAYFVIPIIIFLITYTFKWLFKISDYQTIILINLIVFAFVIALVAYFIANNYSFVGRSKNNKFKIDFRDITLKIVVFMGLGFVFLYSLIITILYAIYRNTKLKDYVIVNIIVSLIVIILIWFYGPVAQILWLSDRFGKDYWRLFRVYQVARVLKTPVILPIYNFIVVSIYAVYRQIVPNEGW